MSLEQEGLFAGKTALILGSVLLVGFTILAGFAALDRAQRSRLEQLPDPSALNDPVVFFLPEASGTNSQTAAGLPVVAGTAALPAVPSASPVAVIHGVPYFAMLPHEWDDGRMRKSGRDDSAKYPVYRHIDQSDKLAPGFWLRFAPNRYLELSPKHSLK